MIYQQDKWYTCFSTPIRDILIDELGYKYEKQEDGNFYTYKDLTKGKLCWCFKRNDDLSWFLNLLNMNSEKKLNLGYKNYEIVEFYKNKSIFPNTEIQQYIDNMIYKSDDFDIRNHVDKKYL